MATERCHNCGRPLLGSRCTVEIDGQEVMTVCGVCAGAGVACSYDLSPGLQARAIRVAPTRPAPPAPHVRLSDLRDPPGRDGVAHDLPELDVVLEMQPPSRGPAEEHAQPALSAELDDIDDLVEVELQPPRGGREGR